MQLVGGDQNPLRRGLLRALAVARTYPASSVVYLTQDADVVGRPSTVAGLRPQSGRWSSFTFEHPYTPRVKGLPQKVSDRLARLGYPPSRWEICGPNLPVIGEAVVDDLILQGWESEVAWAEEMSGDALRCDFLRALLKSMLGQPLLQAVQTVARVLLAEEGIPWPANLTWTSVKSFLAEERWISRLPGYSPEWVWDGSRPGACGVPRGLYLPLEFALRGFRLFATDLPYWSEVVEIAAANGVTLLPPLKVRFSLPAPPRDWPSFFPKGDALHNVTSLAESWRLAWQGKPTVFFCFAHRSLQVTIETATVGRPS